MAQDTASPLVEHARFELKRAGLFDDDSDYGGELGKAILAVIETFATQGHSGGSATLSADAIDKLLRFQPLTPLTSDPAEWADVSAECGKPMWQSKRDPAVFSEDAGRTWASLDDEIIIDPAVAKRIAEGHYLAYKTIHKAVEPSAQLLSYHDLPEIRRALMEGTIALMAKDGLIVPGPAAAVAQAPEAE